MSLVSLPPDVNECDQLGDDYCEHSCANTFGSFQCICRPGATLNSDGRTCSGRCNSESTSLYLTCRENSLSYTTCNGVLRTKSLTVNSDQYAQTSPALTQTSVHGSIMILFNNIHTDDGNRCQPHPQFRNKEESNNIHGSKSLVAIVVATIVLLCENRNRFYGGVF